MADTDAAMTGADMAEATSGSHIQKIPLEVLLRITYFLPTPALCNFRLACRSIEQALYPSFTNEFFTRKQFMLTYESLQALIEISKSRISPHLRIVFFGLDRYPREHQRQHFNATPEGQERYAKFVARHAAQSTLWSTGHHREMMSEAFGNLQNLEDVVIRDFNSRRRTRDGPRAEWRSYGSTTLYEETGIRLGLGDQFWHADAEREYSSQVFSAVLFALGKAGATPKGLEVMSRHHNQLQHLAFNIPPYMEVPVKPVLQQLKKLHLDIGLMRRDIGFGSLVPQADGPDAMVRQFLLYTTGVEHLRINGTLQESAGMTALLEWLGKPETPAPGDHIGHPWPSPLPSPAFEHLQQLDIGSVDVHPKLVYGIIQKYASTLKGLSLWKLNLIRPLPDGHMGSPPKVNFWEKFLEKLRDLPNLELRYIKVGTMKQQWLNRPVVSRAMFGSPNNTLDYAIEYTGPDWRHFVNDSLARLTVDYAPDVGDNSLPGSINGILAIGGGGIGETEDEEDDDGSDTSDGEDQDANDDE